VAAKKIVSIYDEDTNEADKAMILQELRNEIKNGRGIARIQASKMLWDIIEKSKKPISTDEEPITFELANPVDKNAPDEPEPA
jgi:hypothetical protein